jgi:hypothetical protein
MAVHNTTEENLDRLIKMLKMTTSDNDNQALVAMRKSNELLQRCGGDWETLLRGKVTIIGDPFGHVPKPPPAENGHRAAPQTPRQPQRRQAPNAPPRPQATPRPADWQAQDAASQAVWNAQQKAREAERKRDEEDRQRRAEAARLQREAQYRKDREQREADAINSDIKRARRTGRVKLNDLA